jgi:hypothetical protein
MGLNTAVALLTLAAMTWVAKSSIEYPTSQQMQDVYDSGTNAMLQWSADLTNWMDITSIVYSGQCPAVFIVTGFCTNDFASGFIRLKIE